MNRQTPAARIVGARRVDAARVAARRRRKSPAQPPDQPYYERSRMMIDDVDAPLEINDPWEGMNRSIYRFNSYADRYVLNPAVSAYRFVFPGFVRKGISNFFTTSTTSRPSSTRSSSCIRCSAIQTTGRFLVNTTVGVVGLLDPATPIGIPQHYEDFGQTLGRWGVGTGPYLVLPLFGPSFAARCGRQGRRRGDLQR